MAVDTVVACVVFEVVTDTVVASVVVAVVAGTSSDVTVPLHISSKSESWPK